MMMMMMIFMTMILVILTMMMISLMMIMIMTVTLVIGPCGLESSVPVTFTAGADFISSLMQPSYCYHTTSHHIKPYHTRAFGCNCLTFHQWVFSRPPLSNLTIKPILCTGWSIFTFLKFIFFQTPHITDHSPHNQTPCFKTIFSKDFRVFFYSESQALECQLCAKNYLNFFAYYWFNGITYHPITIQGLRPLCY